jgi:hypothetical protein
MMARPGDVYRLRGTSLTLTVRALYPNGGGRGTLNLAGTGVIGTLKVKDLPASSWERITPGARR